MSNVTLRSGGDKRNIYFKRTRRTLNELSPDETEGKVCDIAAVVDFYTFHSHFKQNLNNTLTRILMLFEISNDVYSHSKFGPYNGINLKVKRIYIMTSYSPTGGVSKRKA